MVDTRQTKSGLAGFVRSSAPAPVRALAAVVLLPVWLVSETMQSSLPIKGRYAAVAVIWVATAGLLTLGAFSVGGSDVPRVSLVTSAPSASASASPTLPPGLDDKDCSDFATQKEAQDFFLESGGPEQDLHGLDPNHDGKACE